MPNGSLAAALLLLCPALALASPAAVVRVIDGDTVVVSRGGAVEHVRVAGVDTPELRGGCAEAREAARVARDAVRAWLPPGAAVRLVAVPGLPERDRYGRLLARITFGTRDLGAALLAAGLARPYAGRAARNQVICLGMSAQPPRG